MKLLKAKTEIHVTVAPFDKGDKAKGVPSIPAKIVVVPKDALFRAETAETRKEYTTLQAAVDFDGEPGPNDVVFDLATERKDAEAANAVRMKATAKAATAAAPAAPKTDLAK